MPGIKDEKNGKNGKKDDKSKDDYQLMRAIDLIQGISLYNAKEQKEKAFTGDTEQKEPVKTE